MKIRDLLADLLGVSAIFATGYCLLFLGYGMGW